MVTGRSSKGPLDASEPPSQDARVPIDPKGKAEYFAKIYEKMRWERNQSNIESLQPGKRLMRDSPSKKTFSEPALDAMPRYQVYHAAKRVKLNIHDNHGAYSSVNLIALQNDRSNQVHHFRLLTDL